MNILAILKSHGLVIATHNAGKLKEIQALLAPLGIVCRSAGELGLAEPEETAETFEGNAELKACAAAEASGLPALADDSGLVVPAIGGQPGIYSARWAGEKKDFTVAFQRIRKELEIAGAPLDSPAYFICVLSLAVPRALLTSSVYGDSSLIPPVYGGDRGGEAASSIASPLNPPASGGNKEISASGRNKQMSTGDESIYITNFTGRVDGQLTFPPRGERGFGYDPIFVKLGMTQTFAEIAPEEKHAISHRADAFQKFVQRYS